ncbi:MAG: C69 family dipeptidase [Acidimicrobiales bacterium]
MCDTLCLITEQGTFFAKNSDRPVGEPQVLYAIRERPTDYGNHSLPTQYISIEDEGAMPCLVSRPTWLWGAEHGVNSRHVAIGNEKIYTQDDPYEARPALTGMDLVRLALERSTSSRDAVREIEWLLAAYGQGGIADAHAAEPYWSSFLVADPREAWIVETSGSTWAAKRIGPGDGNVATSACISNRVTLATDWDVASKNVPVGSDFDRWRNQDAPTAHADIRLDASRRFLDSLNKPPGSTGGDTEGILHTASSFAAHLRDHGTGPWGNPLSTAIQTIIPPPAYSLPDGTGVSICMHIRSYQATAAAMITFLPVDDDQPALCWAALGSPCCSIFMPMLPPTPPPGFMEKEATWMRFDHLRQRVEDDPDSIEGIREALSPLETSLWQEARELGNSTSGWSDFHQSAGSRVEAALGRLGV